MAKPSFTKDDLVAALNNKTYTGEKAVLALLNALDEIFADRLSRGERIYLDNIGTFQVKTRKATRRYNPTTGETANVPEHQYVKFTESQTLIERVISHTEG